jgi:PST family polysaccharide transporter
MSDPNNPSETLMSLWIRILPSALKKHIEHRANLQKVAVNIFWLFFDKFMRMGVGLIVGVWTARYLGPSKFGMLNYAGAFVALVAGFASFGLDSIVIRDLVKFPDRHNELLGSAFVLKFIGSILVILVSGALIHFVRDDSMMFALVIISSAGTVFQSLDTIDFYFQANVISKYTVWSKNGAFVLASLVKIILLVSKARLIDFALVGLFELVLGSMFMTISYRYTKHSIFNWVPKLSIDRQLLKESWPLILSTMASIFNMRIGQVILGKMMNDSTVGNYSAAVRISEIWFMIPGVFGASIYPTIIAAKKISEHLYRKRLHQIALAMSYVVLPLALGISLTSGHIINLLYGKQYSSAGPILAIHIWSGVPYLILFAYNQMFYIENLTKIIFYTSLMQPILNIIFSILLIHQYAGIGAATATLVTAVGSSLISMLLLEIKTNIFRGVRP